ncbi:hypothetical protein BC826DRAFT_1030813 [Russula brevipes]|nr:hypothetical protein BC826DRAFT_1030813 [Russula brevipes]
MPYKASPLPSSGFSPRCLWFLIQFLEGFRRRMSVSGTNFSRNIGSLYSSLTPERSLKPFISRRRLRAAREISTPSMSFSDDLFIYHSDIRKDNFLYDIRTGDIWIVDFQHIGVLAKPLQTYTIFNIEFLCSRRWQTPWL